MDKDSFTNLPQIRFLVESGVAYEHADCMLAVIEGSDTFILFNEKPEVVDPSWKYYPCWSLGALIKMLPNPLLAKDKIFYSNFDFSSRNKCTITYVSEDNEVLHLSVGKPITCVVNMIQWLLVSKLIPGKKRD